MPVALPLRQNAVSGPSTSRTCDLPSFGSGVLPLHQKAIWSVIMCRLTERGLEPLMPSPRRPAAPVNSGTWRVYSGYTISPTRITNQCRLAELNCVPDLFRIMCYRHTQTATYYFSSGGV